MDALQWMPFVWLLMAVLLGILEAATIQLVAIWFCHWQRGGSSCGVDGAFLSGRL